jgi:hypothetical protein
VQCWSCRLRMGGCWEGQESGSGGELGVQCAGRFPGEQAWEQPGLQRRSKSMQCNAMAGLPSPAPALYLCGPVPEAVRSPSLLSKLPGFLLPPAFFFFFFPPQCTECSGGGINQKIIKKLKSKII